MEIKAQVYKYLHAKTKVKFDDSSDIRSIGIDSLELIMLITDVEEQLKVHIPDEKLEAIKTVGDVIEVFKSMIR